MVCTQSPLHCINCNRNHDASSNKCIAYISEKPLTLKVKEHISCKEAKEKIQSQYSNVSFVSVVNSFALSGLFMYPTVRTQGLQ